jgi:aerobic-type carbon monoxide dehydrogenase small subunit (CoxS/CutS family)
MIADGDREVRMSDEPSSGFTRRDLVRGALVGAVTAKVGPKGGPAPPAVLGPGPAPLELKVNDQLYTLSVEPRVVLADALRERLGLTGTKVVCGRGACGACTVLVDGQTMCSCLILAHEARGKSIVTIEGLAGEGRLSPIQEAFVAADALQCGFCTSGMVMSCASLLERNKRPSREEIREAIAGNLCRCGTYPHVVDAVERAAGIRTAEARDRAEGERLAAAAVSRLAAGRLASDERVDVATRDLLDEGEAV